MIKELLDCVLRKAKKPISLERIYEKIELMMRKPGEGYCELSDEIKGEIRAILENGIDSYEYFKTPNENYTLLSKTHFRKGIFNGDKNGAGVIIITNSYIDGTGKKVFVTDKYQIDKDKTNGAIDGDHVLFDIGNKVSKPHIVKIIKRNLDSVVGEVYKIGSHSYVRPIDKKKKDLLIALEDDVVEGQIVLVRLLQKTSNSSYIGKVEDVFGHKDDPENDILFEAFKCGIDEQFSEKSKMQVKTIPQKVLDFDKIGRCDLTDWEIFTIDGDDTKDIDDALSCRILPNGNYQIGVHIADVSYYVKKGSPLDNDAFKRGNSYYLGGKVIPMLPHELSNGICSLNEGVERLAKSCIMEVTPEGKVVRFDIIPTVIRSRLKMTYKNVNQILNGGDVPAGYEEHVETLNNLNKLALVLRNNRMKRHAVNFDRPELYFIFDDSHEIVDVTVRKCDLAENLIEEYMLIANETVDGYIVSCGYPCLHRVHDTPNLERLIEYYKFLEALKIPFEKYSPEECLDNPEAMQELAEHIKQNERLSSVLSLGLVKCMSRAKYSPENIGHFGLKLDRYAHFTSPIRRDADLVIHRILNNIEDDDSILLYDDLELAEIGVQTSRTEKIADDAEEQVLRMKCSEFMQKHIGEEYEGTIIGVSDKNIIIQLDNYIEGRVKTKSLNGPYIYNPETYTLLSVNGNENYYVGDRVKVRVKAASKEEKTIDFEIIEKIFENSIEDTNGSNELLQKKKKRDEMNGAYLN